MKKILCLVLSVVMALSCFTAVAFAAEEMPDDIAQLVDNGTLAGYEYYGLPLDMLYTSTDELNWAKLDISWNDLSLMRGNMNNYLSRVFEKRFSRTNLYNGKYATKICNFIGHLFFPGYVDKTITFNYDFAQIDEFYEAICLQSGLTQHFTENICPKWNEMRFNYAPLLTDLGANVNGLPVPDRDIKDGKIVAEFIVKSAVNRAITIGPINYIVSILRNFSTKYSRYHKDPVKALFSYKIQAGYITESELDTFKGLFNLIFNDNNPSNTSKLQLLTPPVQRWRLAKDDTEAFLYLMAYLNIVGKFGNNSAVVTSMQNKINSTTTFDSTEKSRMNKMLKMAFFNEYNGVSPFYNNNPNNAAKAFIEELSNENMNNVKPGLQLDFSLFFERILESIAQFFDNIFRRISSLF